MGQDTLNRYQTIATVFIKSLKYNGKPQRCFKQIYLSMNVYLVKFSQAWIRIGSNQIYQIRISLGKEIGHLSSLGKTILDFWEEQFWISQKKQSLDVNQPRVARSQARDMTNSGHSIIYCSKQRHHRLFTKISLSFGISGFTVWGGWVAASACLWDFLR